MCDQNSTYGLALTPEGCQVGYMCDQNSTYGLHSLLGVRLVTWTILAAIKYYQSIPVHRFVRRAENT
jgi:hypothetical protein